jgi:hypothetical protein
MKRRDGLFAIELIELILGILSAGILLGLTCAIASGEEQRPPLGDLIPDFGTVVVSSTQPGRERIRYTLYTLRKEDGP